MLCYDAEFPRQLRCAPVEQAERERGQQCATQTGSQPVPRRPVAQSTLSSPRRRRDQAVLATSP